MNRCWYKPNDTDDKPGDFQESGMSALEFPSYQQLLLLASSSHAAVVHQLVLTLLSHPFHEMSPSHRVQLNYETVQ